jgi:hypothetical protein
MNSPYNNFHYFMLHAMVQILWVMFGAIELELI